MLKTDKIGKKLEDHRQRICSMDYTFIWYVLKNTVLSISGKNREDGRRRFDQLELGKMATGTGGQSGVHPRGHVGAGRHSGQVGRPLARLDARLPLLGQGLLLPRRAGRPGLRDGPRHRQSRYHHLYDPFFCVSFTRVHHLRPISFDT